MKRTNYIPTLALSAICALSSCANTSTQTVEPTQTELSYAEQQQAEPEYV